MFFVASKVIKAYIKSKLIVLLIPRIGYKKLSLTLRNNSKKTLQSISIL
jgi:hypothetical protein